MMQSTEAGIVSADHQVEEACQCTRRADFWTKGGDA